jgi:hypothetical protein
VRAGGTRGHAGARNRATRAHSCRDARRGGACDAARGLSAWNADARAWGREAGRAGRWHGGEPQGARGAAGRQAAGREAAGRARPPGRRQAAGGRGRGAAGPDQPPRDAREQGRGRAGLPGTGEPPRARA